MSLSQSIYDRVTQDSTIAGLIGTRIYPGGAPEGEAYPYVTFVTVGTEPVASMTGDTAEDNTSVQFDAVSDDFDEMRSLSVALRSRLAGWSATGISDRTIGGAHCTGERDAHDEKDDGTGDLIYRSQLDFSIWHVDTS